MKRLTSNIEGLSARQLAQRCIGAEELSNGRERRLALGDDILMRISSPARYVGGEVNSVMKTLRLPSSFYGGFFIIIDS